MAGNLFYRGVAPGEILAMSYEELRYWDGWHQVMAKAERKPPEGNK